MPYKSLSSNAELMPEWLNNFQPGDSFNPTDFFGSRVVFYPGSGTDGQPVKLFASTGAAHCFVYADFGVSEQVLIRALDEHGFTGYQPFATVPLQDREDVVPGLIEYHVEPGETKGAPRAGNENSFGFLLILERSADFAEDHGPTRIAILFLGADGFATYDALFCQVGSSVPFAVVIQDHGFGGNYGSFGKSGLLERFAERCDVYPEYLLVDENSDPWNGYTRVPNTEGDRGGIHNQPRYLYSRN